VRFKIAGLRPHGKRAYSPSREEAVGFIEAEEISIVLPTKTFRPPRHIPMPAHERANLRTGPFATGPVDCDGSDEFIAPPVYTSRYEMDGRDRPGGAIMRAGLLPRPREI
jgi:hypothetical protein